MTSMKSTVATGVARRLLMTVAVIALAPTAFAQSAPPSAIGGKAQQIIPDIIISSTSPANGDLNPYGVAFVPPGFPSGGPLAPGDILVSNFNNSNNVQGTGTTIIKLTPNGLVAPAGNAVTFFQGTGLGLTTALGVLKRGFVLVGNVPTSNGVIQTGSLLVIDHTGKQIASLTNQLNDPWDLTLVDDLDHATVFVSTAPRKTRMAASRASICWSRRPRSA